MNTEIKSHRVDEFTETFSELLNDVAYWSGRISSANTMYDKRAIARSVFAFIEGVCYQMKASILHNIVHDKSIFSTEEMAMIREESYELDSDGTTRVKRAFIKTLPNIKFAFSAFAKALGSNHVPEYEKKGWDSICKSIKIRDRLMHPKGSADLFVTDEELKILAIASNWFIGNVLKNLMGALENAYEKFGKKEEKEEHIKEMYGVFQQNVPGFGTDF